MQHLLQAHFELMFTSNISWDFIQLDVQRTARSLEQMFTSNVSWDFVQLRCSTCCKLTSSTSNISWDFIQLECSTCCRLTWANVHFEHELGFHPTLKAALAACSLELLRFGLAEGTKLPVPGVKCTWRYSGKKAVHFEQSWDFIQQTCSTYCMLTQAPEDRTNGLLSFTLPLWYNFRQGGKETNQSVRTSSDFTSLMPYSG